VVNTVEILVTGKNLTKPEFDAAVRDARSTGEKSGANFSAGFKDRLGKDLPGLLPPVDPAKPRASGQATGQAFAGGMSPLILGAFAAIATVGPAAVLGATALAVIGAGALITKGNAQVQASYQQLGQHAAAAVTAAAAPLIPQLLASVRVLDDGIAKTGPELQSVFAAAAPMATQLTGGLVSLVNNTLPGMASGLRAMIPFGQQLGDDFGRIGTGLGGFFAALGSGAAGGMQGFTALATIVEKLLPDLGSIVSVLANGLGPALHDMAAVALPVAAGLTAVVNAFPPGAIRAAADATLALFLAFKAASLAGILTEGATFLTFLKGEAVAATVATEATGALAVAETAAVGAAGALGTATSAMLGPFGLLAGALLIAQNEITKYTGVQLNPIGAIRQWNQAENSHITVFGDVGKAAQGAGDAVSQYAQILASGTPSVGQLSSALSTAAAAADASAQSTAANTVAALGGRDGSAQLTMALDDTIIAFQAASGEASAYKLALDASFGKFQDYSAAQAAFTTDLGNTEKALKSGKNAMDLTSMAGAANFTVLSRLADLNESRAEALLRETGSQDQANKSLQAGAIAIDNAAKSAHFSKGQIDALNLALYGTKNIGDIKVKVTADTSAAIAHVVNAIKWIDGQSASFYVSSTGPGNLGSKPGFGHGGIAGAAATGGPRSNLTWVGEHGPELIPLQPGTMVHSNPDSMRMAAEAGRGGGWDGVVRLEVTGDDLIAQWIRNHVRVVAGNAADSVQKTFGQAF
jgi:hypothetical protein